MKFTKSKIITAAIVFFTACTNKGEDYAYNKWDQDRDEALNQEEFSAYWSDEDLQADWDQNADGVVEKDEWETAVNENYGGQWENGSFEGMDADGDTFIDQNEMARGTFSAWDANNDGKIDQKEFENRNYRK